MTRKDLQSRIQQARAAARTANEQHKLAVQAVHDAKEIASRQKQQHRAALHDLAVAKDALAAFDQGAR